MLKEKIIEAIGPSPQATWSAVSQSAAMQAFVQRVKQAKENQEKVFVAGDYDSDGICATSILVRGLRQYGLEVGFYIPDRVNEGYGLQVHTVEQVAQKGYSLIITCDNGVKAYPAIEKAKECGLDIIVTDHHTIESPLDCPYVHPSVLEPAFAYLCGAGVAYECLRALGVDDGYSLALAAIATIGDLVPVLAQSRSIIQKGLAWINEHHPENIVLLADQPVLDETAVSFQIVPKLNAIGRLSHLGNVNNVVRYFLETEPLKRQVLAKQIREFNEMRKDISRQASFQAKAHCQSVGQVRLVSKLDLAEGVIGLVAGQLMNQTNQPVIVFSGNKASMRSPEGFHCMDFLKDYDHFVACGGHARAAGFTVENLDDFTQWLAKHHYTWQTVEKPSIQVSQEELSESEVLSLDELRPFGPGYQLPALSIVEPEIVRSMDLKQGLHKKYELSSGLSCLYFSVPKEVSLLENQQIKRLTGRISWSFFRQQRQLSFLVDQVN